MSGRRIAAGFARPSSAALAKAAEAEYVMDGNGGCTVTHSLA